MSIHQLTKSSVSNPFPVNGVGYGALDVHKAFTKELSFYCWEINTLCTVPHSRKKQPWERKGSAIKTLTTSWLADITMWFIQF